MVALGNGFHRRRHADARTLIEPLSRPYAVSSHATISARSDSLQ